MQRPMNQSRLCPLFVRACVPLALLAALATGCTDALPTPAESAAESDPEWDSQHGALAAPAAKPLAFGTAVTQNAKPGQTLLWTWTAAAGGTFSVKVSNWKKAWMLAKLQRQLPSGAWQTVQTQGGAGGCLLSATPGSLGQYRLAVTGPGSGVGVTASLSCTKGVCAPPVCPATAQAAAQAAKAQVVKNVLPWAKGVLWMSESDYPFDAVGLASAPAANLSTATLSPTPSPAELLAALGLPATAPTQTWPADKLYAALVQQGQNAAKIQALRSAVEAQGTGWTVIRVGTVQVQLYLVGRSPCGALVGLHTVSIET
ncbi:MAG: hypothetical protein HY902_20975 [Deltaproteobacteria bacterium]|nr:hypothetical protein [Deltaproteobacteria bacterium]